MDISLSQLREYGFLAALPIAIAIGLWRERTRLRPWHRWTAVVGLVASSMGLFLGISALRSGGFSGWGALLPLLITFGSGVAAALSVTALLTLAVLLPRYGYDERPAAVRAREYQQWRNPRDRRARSLRGFAFYMGIILIGSLVLKMREISYRRMQREQRAADAARIDSSKLSNAS